MPITAGAAKLLAEGDVLHAPGKASNAGGVAVSGLELSQNSIRMQWSRETVDERLQEIMKEIHNRCVENGQGSGNVDYVVGANVAGFQRVADAVLAYGLA